MTTVIDLVLIFSGISSTLFICKYFSLKNVNEILSWLLWDWTGHLPMADVFASTPKGAFACMYLYGLWPKTL